MSANTASSPNHRNNARNGEKHHESHHGYSDGADRGCYVSRLRGVGEVSRLLLGGVVSMNREVRNDKYDKAIAALVNAKVAYLSWDTWEEHHKLTDAYELVGELFNTSRAQEVSA